MVDHDAIIAIDNSVVNPPEKLFKASRAQTLKNIAFICNFACAVAAMISPNYHTFSCHDYISVLWAHIFVGGQKDGFSLH